MIDTLYIFSGLILLLVVIIIYRFTSLNKKIYGFDNSWCYRSCTDSRGNDIQCKRTGCDLNAGDDCVACSALSDLPDCGNSDKCFV
jgi:hypothetical protein